jgi:SEC-C motif-containing protein
MATTVCPCGSGNGFESCCGPIIDDARPAATAEALMRSRFSAFATGDVAHLRRSWSTSTRPDIVRIDDDRRWTRLEIIDVVDGRQLDSAGVVEFRAHHETGGVAGVLHERSAFTRERGRWVYVSGSTGG